jgi:hypothetical protein
MKRKASISAFIAMACFVSVADSQSPDKAAQTKSSIETPEAKVLKVYSIKDGDYKFVAYVVNWKDSEVVVSDPLAHSDYKVGDTIKFLAQKLHIDNPQQPQQEVYSLSFTLVDLARLRAVPTLPGATVPKSE